MNDFDYLPEKIRRIRQAKGFSQENIAGELHISTSAYGDIERGKTEITLSRISEIARVLAIPVADLLQTGEEPAIDVNWLREENRRLVRENAELAFRNDMLTFCLKQKSTPERKRIGF